MINKRSPTNYISESPNNKKIKYNSSSSGISSSSDSLFNTTNNNNNTPPSSSEPLDELKRSVLGNDGVNDSKQFTLSIVQFEEWTKEQTASILCAPKNQGGASLTPDDVKPLYDAGFKGNVLGNIVVNINELGKSEALSRLVKSKDFQHVAESTLESVVNWVHYQLIPKLYHLWSVKNVKKQLCKSIDEGGVGLNQVVNGNTLKKIMELESEAIGKINNFLAIKDEELAKRIYIWLKSIHNIRVPRKLVSLSNTTITRENVQLLNLEQFYFSPKEGSTREENELTMIPQSTVLLDSFGANFTFVERRENIDSIIRVFKNRLDKPGLDKSNVELPFIAAAPGVGKSRLLKEIGSTVMTRSSIRSEIATTPLFVSFGNGTGLQLCENNIHIGQSLVLRIVYSALLQRSGKKYNSTAFRDFAKMWLEKSDGKNFDLDETFIMVSYILNSNADYYLAIDECHVIDSSKAKDKNDLLEMMKIIGTYVSANSEAMKLYPLFAGTYYTSIHSSLIGSTYMPFFVPIKATLTTESMGILLDDLSTNHPILKNWRTNTVFRHYLRTFSGFPRGVEYFLEEHLKNQTFTLNEVWNSSKSRLYQKYNVIKDFGPMKLLSKYVLTKKKITYETQVEVGGVKTFSQLENIGAIMVNNDPFDPNRKLAFYPTILLARMIPGELISIFELLFFNLPETKVYGHNWEDIIQNYHYLLLSLLTDEHKITLSNLFRFAKMNSLTGSLEVLLPTLVVKTNAEQQIHKEWNIQTNIPLMNKDILFQSGQVVFTKCFIIKNATSAQSGDILILGLKETNIAKETILVFHIQCKWADSEHASLKYTTILEEMEKNNSFKFTNTTTTTHNITVIMTGKDITGLPEDNDALPDDLVIVNKSNFTNYFSNFADQMTFLHAKNFLHINECSVTQLQSFKGIGEVMAKKIIDARPAGGFKNIQDLGGLEKKLSRFTIVL